MKFGSRLIRRQHPDRTAQDPRSDRRPRECYACCARAWHQPVRRQRANSPAGSPRLRWRVHQAGAWRAALRARTSDHHLCPAYRGDQRPASDGRGRRLLHDADPGRNPQRHRPGIDRASFQRPVVGIRRGSAHHLRYAAQSPARVGFGIYRCGVPAGCRPDLGSGRTGMDRAMALDQGARLPAEPRRAGAFGRVARQPW